MSFFSSNISSTIFHASVWGEMSVEPNQNVIISKDHVRNLITKWEGKMSDLTSSEVIWQSSIEETYLRCSYQHISPRYHKWCYFFTALLFTYLEKKNWIHCLARCIFKTPLNVNNYMVPQTLVGGREEFWIHETSLMRLSDRISLALMTLLIFFFPFFFLYLSKA